MQMRLFNMLRVSGLWLALSLGCVTSLSAADLTVFAAASLRSALEDMAEAWAQDTGGELTLVLAGSSAIARQVQAGAPADVVILANTDWMDALDASGDIDEGSRVDLLGNRLVVIGGWHETDPLDLSDPSALSDRLGRGRLALAMVDAVPAGIYAKTALEALGLWDSVADRVVQADNVRAALTLVGVRAANLGVVYATDAGADRRVAVIADIPPDAHPPIVYPAALTVDPAPGADALMDMLNGPLAQAIFQGHGFALIAPR
ncbi:MAG: molybdate ABC transporter substrate-binding protein [Pseudomonadota bacterium]